MGSPMSENQVEKSQFSVTSPLLPRLGDGALQVYRVFALDRNLLTKNIGLCFQFSSSLNKVALTKAFDTAR